MHAIVSYEVNDCSTRWCKHWNRKRVSQGDLLKVKQIGAGTTGCDSWRLKRLERQVAHIERKPFDSPSNITLSFAMKVIDPFTLRDVVTIGLLPAPHSRRQ